eukprot:745663-Alexandrium_andersonii.AAC.1
MELDGGAGGGLGGVHGQARQMRMQTSATGLVAEAALVRGALSGGLHCCGCHGCSLCIGGGSGGGGQPPGWPGHVVAHRGWGDRVARGPVGFGARCGGGHAGGSAPCLQGVHQPCRRKNKGPEGEVRLRHSRC